VTLNVSSSELPAGRGSPRLLPLFTTPTAMRVFPLPEVEEIWPVDEDINADNWSESSHQLKEVKRKPRKSDRADVISRCRAINSNLQAKQKLWTILERIMCAHKKIDNLGQALQDFEELRKKEKEKEKEKEKTQKSKYTLSFAQLPEYNSLCMFRGEKLSFDDIDVGYLRKSIEEKRSSHEAELEEQRKQLIDLLNMNCTEGAATKVLRSISSSSFSSDFYYYSPSGW
jgi:hypothetical protein